MSFEETKEREWFFPSEFSFSGDWDTEFIRLVFRIMIQETGERELARLPFFPRGGYQPPAYLRLCPTNGRVIPAPSMQTHVSL